MPMADETMSFSFWATKCVVGKKKSIQPTPRLNYRQRVSECIDISEGKWTWMRAESNTQEEQGRNSEWQQPFLWASCVFVISGAQVDDNARGGWGWTKLCTPPPHSTHRRRVKNANVCESSHTHSDLALPGGVCKHWEGGGCLTGRQVISSFLTRGQTNK